MSSLWRYPWARDPFKETCDVPRQLLDLLEFFNAFSWPVSCLIYVRGERAQDKRRGDIFSMNYAA